MERTSLVLPRHQNYSKQGNLPVMDIVLINRCLNFIPCRQIDMIEVVHFFTERQKQDVEISQDEKRLRQTINTKVYGRNWYFLQHIITRQRNFSTMQTGCQETAFVTFALC